MKRNFFKRLALVQASALAAAGAAHAQSAPTSVGDLAASVDMTSVGAAILAVGATILGVYVIFKGFQFVRNAVKNG